MVDPIYVVGVGAQGRTSLSPGAAEIVDRADLLVGGERLLAMFPESRSKRLVLRADLDDVLEKVAVRPQGERIAVLASGDPGFFGIAKRLAMRLGKQRVEILPNVSSMQLAFARIKESWEDATFASVHGRSMAGIVELVRCRPKVAILGDAKNSPAAITQALLSAGVTGCRAFLCENLDLPEERVRELDMAELAQLTTSPFSTLILIRQETLVDQSTHGGEAEERLAGRVWPHGIPDEEFYQRRPRRGLITKAEVRLASLARLGLRLRSIVWDIGAGCGSVAIEAALIARQGQVYALERHAADVALVRQNVAKFGTENLLVVHGEAPEALAPLPDPDAVFIGGSGGQLPSILDVVCERLTAQGRVVVNAATIETVHAAGAGLRKRGFRVETTLMQIARSRELAGLTHFEALDPVFVVAARRSPEHAPSP